MTIGRSNVDEPDEAEIAAIELFRTSDVSVNDPEFAPIGECIGEPVTQARAGKLARLRGSLTSRGGFARNMGAMIVWQGANYLAPLMTFPHLSRTLGPAGFGLLGIYLMIGGWMLIVSDWGTNMSGSKAIAQARSLSGEIDEPFWSIFVLRMVIAGLLLVGVIGFLIVTRSNRQEWILLLAAWSMILGNALTVSWCLQGLERLDSFATAALVGRLVTVPATLLLVRHADQAWLAVAIQGGGSIAIGIASLAMLMRIGGVKRWVWAPSGSWEQLKHGFPVFMSVFSYGLCSSSPTMTLGIFHGQVVTGIYVCADRLRQAINGLINPISQVIFPRVSRLAVSDRPAAVRTIRGVLLIQGLGMTAVAGVLAIFAPIIIRIIAGPQFEGSIVVLRIMSATIVLAAVNNVIGIQTLLPFGRQKALSKVVFMATAVNIVVMLALTKFGGSTGAAVSMLITEAFMTVCFLVITIRNRLLFVGTA